MMAIQVLQMIQIFSGLEIIEHADSYVAQVYVQLNKRQNRY